MSSFAETIGLQSQRMTPLDSSRTAKAQVLGLLKVVIVVARSVVKNVSVKMRK